MTYLAEKEAVRRLGLFVKGQLDEARKMGSLLEMVAVLGLIADVATLEALVERSTPLEEPKPPKEPRWEYAWEADPEKRARMNPRGPKYLIDDHFYTPEQIMIFPKGRRVRRTRAGEWKDAP